MDKLQGSLGDTGKKYCSQRTDAKYTADSGFFAGKKPSFFSSTTIVVIVEIVSLGLGVIKLRRA